MPQQLLSPWASTTESSCLQSFPESGSFLMSQFFTSDGQSIGASAAVLPMNIQDWFPLELTSYDLLAVQGTLRSLLQHHSSKTPSVDVNLTKYFCFSVYFLSKFSFFVDVLSCNCSFVPFSITSVTLRLLRKYLQIYTDFFFIYGSFSNVLFFARSSNSPARAKVTLKTHLWFQPKDKGGIKMEKHFKNPKDTLTL